MSPKKKEQINFACFESPISGFNTNSWEYNKALDSLNNVMLSFHGNVRGNKNAIREVSSLYSNKDGNKAFIDIMAKPFLDAIGLDSSVRPSVKTMMDIANNIKIVESDGKVVSYAEKYFDNSTIDFLLDSEKTGKSFGSLLAVHMGAFLSMKSMDELESYKTAFLGNKITPGVSRADQPPRVFITIPNKTPIAVVGSNFVNTENDLHSPQSTINSLDRELLKNEEKILKWNQEMLSCLASADRWEREYNEKLKTLEDEVKSKEEAYESWKNNIASKTDDEIREEYKNTERARLEDEYKKWEKNLDKTYAGEFEERRDKITKNQDEITRKEDREPVVPDPPVETNFFRRIWVSLGGGHSRNYKIKEEYRNQKLSDHQIWESELMSLRENQKTYTKSLDELTKQIEDEKMAQHSKIDVDVEKVPSGAELRAKEETEQKKAVQDARKAVDEHVKTAKPEMEKTSKSLRNYARQFKDRISAANREAEEKQARQENMFKAVTDVDKAKLRFDSLKKNYTSASTELLKQINAMDASKEKAPVLNADYINKTLNNEDVQINLRGDSGIGTLGKDATYKMMEMISSKTMSKRPEEAEAALAHGIIGALDPYRAQELGERVVKHSKTSFSTSSKPFAYRIGKEEYHKMQDNAASKFKEIFGFECTPANVEKVANAINLEDAIEKRMTKVEMNDSEYRLPLITEKNYKDVNLLMMTGIKTAMGMDPLKQAEKKTKITPNVKEKAITVRKPTMPSGMGK
ncbi:MAG: hypothetical protein IJ749_04710 [Eubacterium sp.]|nr:hypothetical protein [Eubacterium sp.]